ncbi:MAG: TIGR04283 family arsenosugar biosynthesis glycosyltransferase [Alphaproteobacteria bacterium]|jgi:rSAM/selenodomain-associated transferase 2|nr:TIGR04283 family arsenosugar biosynthesis glycosyltransferase [Alphaproteobacteria bacterium]|tara:strand:- start:54 stop:740 length:687 start_codon:yes stop_codon:yes gene_type:complete
MGRLSIVIPTFNAAGGLARTIASLYDFNALDLIHEVVVADGGSTDETQIIVEETGARLIAVERGRGSQLAAGAEAARGAWLLFLHADTALEAGWHKVVGDFIAAGANRERAGYFRFALEDGVVAARRLERIVAWRCRMLGLPYGDQGLLISHTLYDRVGGYRPLPLMEDVDLARRLGRRRLVALGHRAVTSAKRYREEGYMLRPARNLLCLALYYLGLPPRAIQRLYG